MSFIPYQEYVSAGIGWLDEVPAHWEKVPLKYTALEPDSLFLDGDWIESKDISDDGIKYITTGNVGEGVYKEQGAGFITDEVFGRLRCTEVFPGDILVSRLNYPIGRSCIIPELSARIVTSVDNVIYRPDDHFNKSYLVYLMSSGEYFSHTSDLARGTTMQRISRSLLGNIRIPVPTREEQIRIAAFLDHETTKIDALIAEQQRLIELLKEKRQAVISHAVTKGLNPNAPMKDSGVEWLGEVPAHWKVIRLKQCSNYITSGPRGWSDFISDDGGSIFLQSGDLDDEQNVLVEKAKRISPPEGAEGVRTEARSGDVLVCITGANTGRVGVINEISDTTYVNQHLALIRIDQGKACPSFVAFSLSSHEGQSYFSVVQYGLKEGLSLANVDNAPLCLPPLSEQHAIVEIISARLLEISDLLVESEKVVQILKERRAAVISAAVTGKIDVRNWRSPKVKVERDAQNLDMEVSF
jgi:type I restriction enzyme S subunit